MSKPLHLKIRERFQLGPANHMTHIDNLAGILAAGELRSYNLMRGTAYNNLSNLDVQQGRAGITVAVSGRALHDYVPLYFGFKTPMVAWNQDKNEQLIFLRFSLNILALPDVVVSDGNARSTATKFVKYGRLDDLAILDPKAIQTVKYAHDPELKRRKQAEILVPDKVQVAEILDVMCFSPAVVVQTLEVLRKSGINRAVRANPGWYFSKLERQP